MLELTLPDGSVRTVAPGTLPRDVVAGIGPRLLRDAVAVEVNGTIQDLNTPLNSGGSFRVLTASDPRSLDVLRHSGAHILATAVRRLRPDAQIGFGPAIEDGFYYDFGVSEPFTPDDLNAFETEMHKVVSARYPFAREQVTREEAVRRFADDHLKLERIADLGDDEVISIYTDGPFIDLCRGPHVPDTSYLKHFKLLHTAGAYWRGDERRPMLQRIYATAWWTKDDLEKHLHRIEEAKRRDHRTLGAQLDLFSTDPRVGPGLILWHPNGAMIRSEIENFERDLILRRGYELVYTPHLFNERMFEISGHLQNFSENMFGAIDVEGTAYRPKPMNCPGHIAIFQSRARSYRDLPVRYAEFGTLYRYERSGVLHGLLRVRGFTQDDAHVFCTPEQAPSEIGRLLDLVDEMLTVFGYEYTVELSTKPVKSLGTVEEWSAAEQMLASALQGRGRAFTIDAGGGAFYGPKLDFKLVDAIGRKWQGPTVQLDFNLPARFDLTYTGADNAPHRPVMLHRVLLGSMERFVGGLIEHYAGAFPSWLAPEQVRVLPVTDEVAGAASLVDERLKAARVRSKVDTRSETLNYRIRDAALLKIPYLAVVGRREAADGTVAVTVRGAGKQQHPTPIPVDIFVRNLREEIDTRSLTLHAAEGGRAAS